MSYQRILPRDLFNEAKLLKCMGQLALFIHDYEGGRWKLRLMQDMPGRDFHIRQDRSSGDIYVDNLHLMANGHIVPLHSSYNSKEPFTLLFAYVNPVFNQDGTFTQEFEDYLDVLCKLKGTQPTKE